MSKRVLVYGGCGALGDTLVNFLKSKNCWIVSIDLKGEFRFKNMIFKIF